MLENKNAAQRWEDIYPSALSFLLVLASAAGLVHDPAWIEPVITGISKLAPSTLNIGAIAVGFLATAQALLLSLGDSPALKALRCTYHYKRLITFFARALAASFVSSLLSALLTALQLNLGGGWRYACAVLWAFSGLVALLCYFRASKMLSIILHLNGRTEPTAHEPEADQRQNDVEIIEG